jgi:hypothetical protein
VTRTVVSYVSVGFAVLEATWYLVPQYGLVADVSRVVMGLVVLGFPFTVVLAWTYDITPEGIVRTPDTVAPDRSEAPDSRVRRFLWLSFCTCVLLAGLVFRALRL